MTDLTRIYGRGVPFTVAKQYAPRFQALLDDPEWGDYAFDASQSGGYNPRNIAGTNTPSQHAFGRAIDINWTRNARGTPGDINPDLARRLAQLHGFTWGGDWRNPDPMHFEIDPKWGGQVAASSSTPLEQRSLTAYAGLGGPQPSPQPQDTAMANGNGILSTRKLDPQEELMGLLGDMQSQTPWDAMIQAGAGLAANSANGWGAGIGAALQGVGNVLGDAQQQRMRGLGLASEMQARNQQLALQQQKASQPASTELIRNYQAALLQGFKGDLIDFQKAMRAESTAGPSPYIQNPDGTASFRPGGPADPAVIKEQSLARGKGADVPQAVRTEAIKADQAYNNLTTALDDYEKTIKKTGNVYLAGADKDAVMRKRRNLQLQLKELYNLGVLNGPDLSLMNEMLFDPNVSLNPFSDNFGIAFNVGDRVSKSVADLKEMLRGIRNSKTQAIGMPDVGPGGGQAASMPDPLGIR